MALTFVKKPAALILTGQPVAFTVSSNNAGTPLRIKASVAGSADGDSIAVDVNKQAEFEISDYLQGKVTEWYKTGSLPVKYTVVPVAVQFTFGELVGSPAVAGDTLTSEVFYLLDAYVPHLRRRTIYALYPTLQAYLAASRSFLTWWPANTVKSLLPEQKDFLNYIQLYSRSPISLTLAVTLNFTDGTHADTTVFAPVANIAYMRMVYFPTGYAQLGIAALMAASYPAKTLDHYVVSIVAGSTTVSALQRYSVDNASCENVRYLYIRNAFGMLEIVRCTGQGEQHNEYKIETVETDGRVLVEKLSWRMEKTDTVKVNTGHYSKAQMQWLSELNFLEAYEMFGDVLQAIVFKDLSLPVIHDNVYQYDAELEYEYVYNEITEQA